MSRLITLTIWALIGAVALATTLSLATPLLALWATVRATRWLTATARRKLTRRWPTGCAGCPMCEWVATLDEQQIRNVFDTIRHLPTVRGAR